MKNTILTSVLLFVISLSSITFSSCEGEEGPAGSQGPQGPQGLNANSNIQVYQYLATPSSWFASSGAAPTWNFSGSLPALTQHVLENDTVLFFWTQSGTQTLMPFSINDVEYMYYSAIFSNTGTFQIQVSKKGPYLDFNPGTVAFKVIIIPKD